LTKNIDWTSELKETLRQLWDSGMTARQIAVVMGLRKNQIIGASHRYKMPPRPSPIVRSQGYKPPPRDRPLPKPAGRPQKPATPRGDRKPQPTPAHAPRVWSGRCCFPTWNHRQPKTKEYRAALREAKYLECGDPVCSGAGDKPALYCACHYAVMFTHARRPSPPPTSPEQPQQECRP
jgi:GcrA cell cycle regulator